MADENRQQIELVKDAVSVDFYERHIPGLKKAGSVWKACCPFHNERTPSFTVYPDGHWRCYGACADGGDAISFYQKKFGTDFLESLEKVGNEVGVVVQVASLQQNARLFAAAEMARDFFFECLMHDNEAKAYLKARGLNSEIAKRWGIGVTPMETTLFDHLTSKGFTSEELLDAGLVVKLEKPEDDKLYRDRFIDRIMFTICNSGGHPVGFSGRIFLKGDKRGAKYLNTDECKLFHKGDHLYGLNKARGEIGNTDTLVCVEGYMDALMLSEGGFRNTVAIMGTAITNKQIGILKRYAKRIVLAMDPDSAGDASVIRNIPQLVSVNGESIDLYVARYSGGDPDEIVRADPKRWQAILDSAEEAIEYAIRFHTSSVNERTTPRQKQEILKRCAPLLVTPGNKIQTLHNHTMLAQRLNLPVEMIASPNLPLVSPPAAVRNSDVSQREWRFLVCLIASASSSTGGEVRIANWRRELASGTIPIPTGEFFHYPVARKLYLLAIEAMDQFDESPGQYIKARMTPEMVSFLESENPEDVACDTDYALAYHGYRLIWSDLTQRKKKLGDLISPTTENTSEFYRLVRLLTEIERRINALEIRL